MKLRPTVSFLASITLSASLIACGGGDDGDGNTDDVVVEGDPHPYVIDTISTDSEGEDVDGDGTKDNQLGQVIATLESEAVGIPVSATLTSAVDEGSIILLADMTTTNFTDATGAGFTIFIGDNPGTAPCTDPEDPATCRQHLDGSTTFDIKADSPTDGTVPGSFSSSGFFGDDGLLNLQIALAEGSDPINVRLVNAIARLQQIDETGIMEGTIAGAIPEEDINGEILPAVVDLVAGLVETDCAPDAGGCNCMADSGGDVALGFFDADDDCAVTLEEIQNNALIGSLLAPETDTDGDGTKDALSMGVGITAVGAVFDNP
jgi:hypothetical protein